MGGGGGRECSSGIRREGRLRGGGGRGGLLGCGDDLWQRVEQRLLIGFLYSLQYVSGDMRAERQACRIKTESVRLPASASPVELHFCLIQVQP